MGHNIEGGKPAPGIFSEQQKALGSKIPLATGHASFSSEAIEALAELLLK
jgi:hypothetical protein